MSNAYVAIGQRLLDNGQTKEAAVVTTALESLRKQDSTSTAQSKQIREIATQEREKGTDDGTRDAVVLDMLANEAEKMENKNHETQQRKEQMSEFVEGVQQEVKMLEYKDSNIQRECHLPKCNPNQWCSHGFWLVLIILFLVSGWLVWGGIFLYSHQIENATSVKSRHVVPMVLITFALLPMIFLKARSPEEEQYERGQESAWLMDEHFVWLRSMDRTLILIFISMLLMGGLGTLFFMITFDFVIQHELPAVNNATQAHINKEKSKHDSFTAFMLILSITLNCLAMTCRIFHIHSYDTYIRRLRGKDNGVELTALH